MDKETKTKLIKYGVVAAVLVVAVLWGRSYFGPEQFNAVLGLCIVFLAGGCYLGATKSKSLTKRIDRDSG